MLMKSNNRPIFLVEILLSQILNVEIVCLSKAVGAVSFPALCWLQCACKDWSSIWEHLNSDMYQFSTIHGGAIQVNDPVIQASTIMHLALTLVFFFYSV
ncbi:hypothetical protein DAI22_02g393800 [Oryza sativa Japonica Group]|nr:hypothetical protein DAI22_02g393800 [Oryza sativa Japonica Group]